MTNYVLLYKGGGVPATEEEQRQVMADWAGWYERLGQAVVDGGNPFGPPGRSPPTGRPATAARA